MMLDTHQLPAQLVVSLTSYPPRFNTLDLTLHCLLRQTVKADHTILWLAHSDFSSLPKNILDLQSVGLEIRTTDDLKSYKKILPALDAFPDAFICTADDDIYYCASWLEELLGGVSIKDGVATCHRAHEIVFDEQGKFRPYNNWLYDTHFRGKSQNLFPTGGAGVLYPPGLLTHTTQDRMAIFSLCPHADDIWVYWMARRNGITYMTVGRRRDLISWRGSQNEALWRRNSLPNGNDEQIRKMAERYGYPETRD